MREKLRQFKKENNIEIIEKLLKINNGYVTSKTITDLGIHRMYLNMMQKEGMIERVSKGIYIDTKILNDSYYTFQLRYPKVIFSYFTALYLYELTEVYPSNFDVTVPSNFHNEIVSKECRVHKCKDEFINMGLTTIKTKYNHDIRLYDRERCICDIIKHRNRLDLEQVKKAVKFYVNDKNKDINKLSIYAKKMNIYNDVMEYVGMFYE